MRGLMLGNRASSASFQKVDVRIQNELWRFLIFRNAGDMLDMLPTLHEHHRLIYNDIWSCIVSLSRRLFYIANIPTVNNTVTIGSLNEALSQWYTGYSDLFELVQTVILFTMGNTHLEEHESPSYDARLDKICKELIALRAILMTVELELCSYVNQEIESLRSSIENECSGKLDKGSD